MEWVERNDKTPGRIDREIFAYSDKYDEHRGGLKGRPKQFPHKSVHVWTSYILFTYVMQAAANKVRNSLIGCAEGASKEEKCIPSAS